MDVISIDFSNRVSRVSNSILAVQPGRYGLHVYYKVGETWLDHCTLRVVI